MKEIITISAPAKINLHLQVFPKREDGFHDLRSLFVMISLYDHLRIVPRSGSGCRVSGFAEIPPRENLIWKAHAAYVKETGEDLGVDVQCDKHIPPMSGLGGGSSDAAALLKALQLLRKSRRKPVLDNERLKEIAGGLGSDVPFFLGQSAALVEGRGELLKAIPTNTVYDLVLVRPEIDVPTGEAYRRLDTFMDTAGPETSTGVYGKELPPEHIEREFLGFSPEKWSFFNSFTPVLAGRYRDIEAIIDDFHQKGAAYANLSGSGSAVYGVFLGEEQALEAAKFFKRSFINVWKVKMLASAPEAVYNIFG